MSLRRLAALLEHEHMLWERRYLSNQASKEEDEALSSLVRTVLDDNRLVQFVRVTAPRATRAAD